MNYEEYYKLIKNFSYNTRTNEKKDVYMCNEHKYDEYELGTIINKYSSNDFEVYLYIEIKKEVCSGLLYRTFSEEITAKKYFDELTNFSKNCTLEALYLKLLSEKV